MEQIADTCPGALSGTSSQIFLTLLQALVTSRCSFKTEYPNDYGPALVDGDEYDFVIVGAGSAGSVLANRLSQVSQWRVLLVEAGTYPSMATEIPMLFQNTYQTDEDWNYQTQRSETCCLSLNGNRCLYPRGKVLGGSSSINAMMYVRSTKQNHDDWVAAGNTIWDYATVQKHYKNIEKQLKTTKYVSNTPLKSALVEAYEELGYTEETIDNLNGYGDIDLTIGPDGTRSSAAKAFLQETKNRANMHLALNSHVVKITLDDNNQATGIDLIINKRQIHIKAKKEVIVSSGTINTAQILMLSGIGPKEHLKQIGITTKRDLKVGHNLQDHVVFMELAYNLNASLLPPSSEKSFLDTIYNYFMHRTGPLAQPELYNFHFTTNTKNSSKYPNLEIHHVPLYPNSQIRSANLYDGFNYPPEVVELHLENNKKSGGILLFPKALTTKSKGKILLRSADPFDQPLIYPNFFSDPEGADLELLLDAVKLIKKVMKTKAFAKANPQLVMFPVSNCKQLLLDSDEYWRCAIRNLGTHLHHPVGTCKMGPKSDPEAVVDPTLKVHGVKGLRVVDASVIPKIPSCNTNPPVMMIADKAAELIKEEWMKTHTEL